MTGRITWLVWYCMKAREDLDFSGELFFFLMCVSWVFFFKSHWQI